MRFECAGSYHVSTRGLKDENQDCSNRGIAPPQSDLNQVQVFGYIYMQLAGQVKLLSGFKKFSLCLPLHIIS